MTPPLGRLEQVDLRSAWDSEPLNFTPWLAQPENIALLSEAVGIALEVVGTEQRVGPFSADILCRDALDGNYVLIENQLERTDHTHLGQLLTYAAGRDAVTIIWIARRFADEHRAALDWLNNKTTSGLNFFGLEVELWKIGESPMAPKFNVVCQPNDWTTRVRQHTPEGPLTEDRQLRLDFWTQFHQYLEDNGKQIIMSRPTYGSYASSPVGRTGFLLYAALEKNGKTARVYLRISGQDREVWYRSIKEGSHQVVHDRLAPLGKLDWRDLPNAKERQVSISRPSNLSDRETWRELHAWLAVGLETMRDVFSPIAASLETTGGETDVELSLGDDYEGTTAGSQSG